MIRMASCRSFAATFLPIGRLLALVTALSGGGCARSPSPAISSTTLTIATAIPRIPDPGTGIPAILNSLTLEAPLGIAWDGTITPRAIDKWEWSPDGLALRLHLPPGVVFHDGTPLTNAITADILRDALGPNSPAVSATVESVTADGAEEIVIRTGQPEGFLLSDISIANFSLPGRPQVGTGPFRLESDDDQISLRAFDGYRSGRPAIGEMRIAEYPTQRQAWADMMRGKVDGLYDVSVEAMDFVKAGSTVATHPFLRSYYHALVFNLRLPLFARRDVRRALNTAVDRRAVVDVALRKHGIPADGPIWPRHFGHNDGQPAYRYDPRAAEALLDALGLTRGRDHQPGRMPSRFRFTCLIPREDLRLHRIALLLQKQLFEVGVDMAVEALPLREMRPRVARGQFEAMLSEFGALRTLGFVYSLWRSPAPGTRTFLDLHYSAADAALDRLRAALDPADVRRAVADVQRAFHDDPPAVFLDWMETTRALSRRIEIPGEGGRDIFAMTHQWRPVPAAPPR
jgi:peptide/nickel transport system substrate-binding protein